ncbi:DsbA family protein [Paucibacter sp. KCTC 42545]|uniref:DsbA family protein n=1 Tax=Paucibacter sp. KCTC 42545 TaxID=1768242 RepID=UPI000733BDBE|nr:DsbA family protein [Paucibacter sp. KCTC 42545]ALT76294.1 protein-disulfide isomerase [Paucibacter sp. KCTC 42545]
MNKTRLHYIHDPLCGWCYGAAPLVKAAREVIPVLPRGGGMMTGARRQRVTAELRSFVMAHDVSVAQASGQRFGEGYQEGLLRDATAVFDSEPPTAAMLAAEAMAGRGLDLLAQLQTAHYVDGLRIADRAVLIEMAAAIGLDPEGFAQALDQQLGGPVQAHIKDSRAFMAQVGAQGFPSMVLETEGGLQTVNVSSYLGRPQDFQAWLRSRTPSTQAAPAFGCDADGCAI